MRRVFLSFLGTNDYISCNYLYGDFPRVANVRFVQEALVKWLCRDWTVDDEILIFSTQRAIQKNWLDGGHTREDGAGCEGLQTRFAQLGLTARCTLVTIPSGRSEQEIWKIFDTFVQHINAGDHLYLDITHAFRSLPMLAMVLLNYIKILQRDIRVESICYGAMEALGELRDVRAMPVAHRDVQVINLLPFDRLNDWSIAIDRFIVTGDARQLSTLTNQDIKPILVETKGQDHEAEALRSFSSHLELFAAARNTCRGRDLHSSADDLCTALAKVKEQNLIPALKPLLKMIEEEVVLEKNDEILEGIAAAEWCLKRNLFQQGYTILQETMFSFLQRKAFGAVSLDTDERTLISQSLKIASENTPRDKWKKEARLSPEKTLTVIDCLDDKIIKLMRNLTNGRNDINHCGMRTDSWRHQTIKHKLEDFIQTAWSIAGNAQ